MEKDVQDILSSALSSNATVISPLVGGMMNRSFVVQDNNKKYVLYISTEQANEMVDRKVERNNQMIIYDLGLTSKNVYFDIDKGIKINEYIEGSSLDKADSFDSKKVASLLKKMHQSGRKSEIDYLPFKRFDEYEHEASIFQSFEKEYLLLKEALFKRKDFLLKQPLTLCHNDAQKSNIVKDLNNNYYLIDFEFMGNNDPIYDIATFGNGTVVEGFALLNEYDPNQSMDLMKRYYLWRIFISLQWYNVALVKHYRGEGKIHNFNFLSVAAFFLDNAKTANNYLSKL